MRDFALTSEPSDPFAVPHDPSGLNPVMGTGDRNICAVEGK